MSATETKRTGVEAVVWDNLGNGWRMYCLCGWATDADDDLQGVASEMDDHWCSAIERGWLVAVTQTEGEG